MAEDLLGGDLKPIPPKGPLGISRLLSQPLQVFGAEGLMVWGLAVSGMVRLQVRLNFHKGLE